MVVVYAVDPSKFTHEVLQNIGQCQTGENPNPKLGFYNAVEMENDDDGAANNNACSPGNPTATMKWEKADGDGNLLSGSVFTLHQNGSNFPSQTANGFRISDCEGQVCTTNPSSSLSDQNGDAGKFQIINLPVPPAADSPLPYIVETQSPTGYDRTDRRLTFEFSPTRLEYTLVNVTDESQNRPIVENGQVRNYVGLGEITWSKVNEAQQLLAGSEWQISGGRLTSPIAIRDCVANTAAGCATQAGGAEYYDLDNRAGYFTVKLPKADGYLLVETQAPAGFILPDATQVNYPFDVPSKTGQITTGGKIVNKQVTVPQIPFTGGMGSDAFLIGGGALLAVAGAGVFARKRQRHKQRD